MRNLASVWDSATKAGGGPLRRREYLMGFLVSQAKDSRPLEKGKLTAQGSEFTEAMCRLVRAHPDRQKAELTLEHRAL